MKTQGPVRQQEQVKYMCNWIPGWRGVREWIGKNFHKIMPENNPKFGAKYKFYRFKINEHRVRGLQRKKKKNQASLS